MIYVKMDQHHQITQNIPCEHVAKSLNKINLIGDKKIAVACLCLKSLLAIINVKSKVSF